MDTEVNAVVGNNYNVVSNETVKYIIKSYFNNDNFLIDHYVVQTASNSMLGFLSDYYRLTVSVVSKYESKQKLHFFIKAITQNNAAKAAMVKEMNLFNKEISFYTEIKMHINKNDLKKWSPNLIVAIEDGLVFEDLMHLNYKMRNKFLRFDMAHTLQALETLATFHSLSIIYENKRKNIDPLYSITEDYVGYYLDEGGYSKSSSWFIQCMSGALEAVKSFSKYRGNLNAMNLIERNWNAVWTSALSLSKCSTIHRSVICHRDLWNNNILFHYKNVLSTEPDGCVLVDFQAIRVQPPAGDVMMLLYCNLDPKLREENMKAFLDYYYNTLANILEKSDILINNVLNKEQFMASVEEQRKWGIITCACLLPSLWIDDVSTTTIFTDSNRFDDIMTHNKGAFIKQMMHVNDDYKCKVMEIFDEIIERYIL